MVRVLENFNFFFLPKKRDRQAVCHSDTSPSLSRCEENILQENQPISAMQISLTHFESSESNAMTLSIRIILSEFDVEEEAFHEKFPLPRASLRERERETGQNYPRADGT